MTNPDPLQYPIFSFAENVYLKKRFLHDYTTKPKHTKCNKETSNKSAGYTPLSEGSVNYGRTGNGKAGRGSTVSCGVGTVPGSRKGKSGAKVRT